MSDYIDENFEMDETDEFWGVQKTICNSMDPKRNDLKMIDN